MDVRKEADNLLELLATAKVGLEHAEQAAREEMEAVQRRYEAEISLLSGQVKGLETDLKKIMKAHKGHLFDGSDTVALEHGILMYTKETRVSIPRDALEKIEAGGWNEAVKVAKSVDRAVVEKWPEERLFSIGAKRKPKEVFNYEVKDSENGRRRAES